MIYLAASPIPIGHTTGFLFRVIRWQARKGVIIMVAGSTKLVQRCRAVMAREWHWSLKADLNDVHNLL